MSLSITAKRIVALVMMLIMALAVLSLSGCKETNEIVYELNADGTGYIVTTDGKYVGTEITIPSEHEGLPVLGIEEKAFRKCKYLESVVIEGGVNGDANFEIGMNAFKKCKALKSVIIERTGQVYVHESAFLGCEALETVDILQAKSVTLNSYSFQEIAKLTMSISGAGIQMYSDTFYNAGEECSYSLNLTDCTGSVAGVFANLNLVNSDFDVVSISATNLVLDNTKLLQDEMYIYAANATFRNNVVYQNHYKESWISVSGGIINNLVIESIGPESKFYQIHDDEYYPLANNITIGSAVTRIPAGIFGDCSFSDLKYLDYVAPLTVTYDGASAVFKQIPYDTQHNGNLNRGDYTLQSDDGQPAKVTFADALGNAVATADTTIGAALDSSIYATPNTTLVPGEIVNGYWRDAEQTQAWGVDSVITGDTTVYVSFVERALLQKAEIEKTSNGLPFVSKNDSIFTYGTNKNYPVTLEQLRASFAPNELATLEFYGDLEGTASAPELISTIGLSYVYAHVTSWDKSVTKVYVLEITVKDVYQIIFTSDGSDYDTRYCIEGDALDFPSDPDKRGYTFLGWSTDSTEDGIISAVSFVPTESCILTAVFSQDIYTLRIEGTDHEYQVVWAQAVPLPLAESRDYYEFVGYEYGGELVTDYINDDGCGISRYFFEQSITLKPRYEPIGYGIVLYNGSSSDTIFFTVEDDDITLPTPSREWYDFVGWFTQENGAGDKIVTVEASTPESYILYAHFEPTSYTVRFMDGETVIDTQSFDYNDQTIVPPTVPQKDGYTSEWADFTVSAKDFDVQVVRTPIAYTITYENTFGSTNYNPDTYTVEDEIVFKTLSREHYDFVGWQDENGDTVAGISKGTLGDITVSARWTVAKYTVYMFTSEEAWTTQEVEYNTEFNVDSVEIPTATDKLFVGWYNHDYTEQITGKITVTGDVSIYAMWLESTSISSVEDFEKISENPSGTFHLASDVDMRGELVTPISEFSGVLDGKGFKLYNFTLKINSTLSSFGLFNVNGGTIRNLTLDEVICSVTTYPSAVENDHIGILVGTNKGTISNCTVNSPNFTVTSAYSNAYIEYTLHIGGLVGKNNGTVVNCRTNVNLTAVFHPQCYPEYYGTYSNRLYSRVGGLVGTNSGTITSSSTVSVIKCTGNASGNNKGSASNTLYVGGLVGVNDASYTIERCFASVDVSAAANLIQAYASGSGNVGAFIGVNNGIVTEGYATGSVSSYTYNTGYVGGFVGNVGAGGDVSNCYTTAIVTSSNASDVGGFVGRLSGSVQNCYSAADVTVTSGSNVAGFVGVITSGGVANKCFTTGNVNAKASNVGFFSANTSDATGIITNSYYSASATVLNSGTALERAEENGAKRDYLSSVINREFLQNKMYFYPEYWIFTTGTPILKWEIQTDGTGLTDGSYYCCTSCGAEFVNGSSVNQTAIYYDKAVSCETDAIRYFGCSNCNKHFAVVTQQATGHSYSDDSEGKDFCNDDVLVTYVCTNSGCGDTYTKQLYATGHQHDHTDSCIGCGYVYIPSSCDVDGSVTFICDDCGNEVTKKIPAEHVWKFVSWDTEPTCTSDGYGEFACSRCTANGLISSKYDYVQNSRLGHVDLTGDGICDREECEQLIYDATDAITISTAEELLAIGRNASLGSLEQTYILTANIDLKDVAWEPIGSKDNPFLGVFLGGGFKIKNLPLYSSNTSIDYCGLFGYNSGVISNLTVQYDSYSAAFNNRNMTFGSIAAFNDGTINRCAVEGTVAFGFLTKAEVNENGASATAAQSVTLGLVAGVNNGFIVGCNVSASYSFTFENYAFMGEEIDHVEMGLLTSGNYRNMSVKTTQTVVAGAVCGINNMSITGCAVSGTGTVYNYLALSQFLDGAWGYLSATSTQSFGTIAGNQNLVGVQSNSATGSVTYSNAAGTHNPTAGNDPGNSYYSMSCQTTVAIYE